MANRKKDAALADCINQLQARKDLICGSFTNHGFIDRLVNDFMSLMRTHPATKGRVKIWEKYLFDSSLRDRAYRELHEGYVAIRGRASSLGETSVIEVLDNILRKVSDAGDYHSVSIPPYERVFPHYRAYHMHLISRDIPFAPSVLLLKERDSHTYQLREADHDPKYLWAFLLLMERCWKIGREVSYRWSMIKEEGIKLWLESDRLWREARDSVFAAQFEHADNPKFSDSRYFDRAFTERLLDRIIKEISLISERDDPRTRDKDNAVTFIENYWLLNPCAKHEDVLKALQIEIQKKPKLLELSYERSTFISWIRSCDKRENKPRGPGKRR